MRPHRPDTGSLWEFILMISVLNAVIYAGIGISIRALVEAAKKLFG